ncbi:MAG: FixH family protein [Hyphomicrobiales bacterium]
MKYNFLFCYLLSCIALSLSTSTVKADTKTTCNSSDTPLTYQCSVIFKNKGKLLTHLEEIMVKVDMPSMPMAHNIPPVKLKADHKKKGKYNFDIKLDMHGKWLFVYDITKPQRDRYQEKILFLDEKMNPTRKEHHYHDDGRRCHHNRSELQSKKQ